ncbi:hypothetical protein BJV78DRAFT_190389 [Lactifluus subvellereus]|nr:hypothetical protein BJV78DRAFT_190389 [Lactifluus subvellereus]
MTLVKPCVARAYPAIEYSYSAHSSSPHSRINSVRSDSSTCVHFDAVRCFASSPAQCLARARGQIELSLVVRVPWSPNFHESAMFADWRNWPKLKNRHTLSECCSRSLGRMIRRRGDSGLETRHPLPRAQGSKRSGIVYPHHTALLRLVSGISYTMARDFARFAGHHHETSIIAIPSREEARPPYAMCPQ